MPLKRFSKLQKKKEVNNMKKALTISILVFLPVLLAYGFAGAITGNCVNCHTMHNSQNGLPMAIDATGNPQTQPIAQLLRADCIPCHSGPVDVTQPLGRTNQFGAPIVLGNTDPTGQGGTLTLAGGDFWWVATGTPSRSDTKGHNVAGIAPVDTIITFPNGQTPPGWDSVAPIPTPGALNDGTIHNGAATWSNQLTCAGLYGCHGNHSDADQMAGIRGAHHGNVPGTAGGTNTQANNPTSLGGSYRFLGGINGLEHVNWNYNESSASHNEYYGVDGNTAYANKRTISYACAQCHGNFHSDIGTSATVWLRHPTDIVLPAIGEYGTYNPDAAGVYSVEAPVARGTVPATSSATVTEGDGTGATGAIVMCISCHRAHSSPIDDILRWQYTGDTGIRAGVGTADTGCFTCHTAKNAD